MHDWIELELARQRREELLHEAHERRMSRVSGGTPVGELKSPVRRLIRILHPERTGGLAAVENPGVSIHGCSAD